VSSEQANVVTLAIRRHGYRDFHAVLEQLISEQRERPMKVNARSECTAR